MSENTKMLLIAQMTRAIELLKQDETDRQYTPYSAELEKKLHEIRRDSIRYIKEKHPWRR